MINEQGGWAVTFSLRTVDQGKAYGDHFSH
jgi:hypothetical protein